MNRSSGSKSAYSFVVTKNPFALGDRLAGALSEMMNGRVKVAMQRETDRGYLDTSQTDKFAKLGAAIHKEMELGYSFEFVEDRNLEQFYRPVHITLLKGQGLQSGIMAADEMKAALKEALHVK